MKGGRPLKRWRYVGVFGDEVMASFGVVRIGVLPQETVTVEPWFGPYNGRYVFHCHALEHADRAMMLQLEVEA